MIEMREWKIQTSTQMKRNTKKITMQNKLSYEHNLYRLLIDRASLQKTKNYSIHSSTQAKAGIWQI